MLCSIGPSAQSIRKEFGPRSGETAPGNGPTLFIYSGSGGGRQPSLKQSWKLSRSASYRKLVFRGPCHLRNHDCFRECRFYKSLLTSGRIRWQARRILRCGSCCKTSKANQHTFLGIQVPPQEGPSKPQIPSQRVLGSLEVVYKTISLSLSFLPVDMVGQPPGGCYPRSATPFR